MSFYLIVFIVIVSLEFLTERILSFLNKNSYGEEMPEEGKKIYDAERYQKARDYFLVNYRFSNVSSWFSFLLLLSMLLCGGFGWIDNLIHEKFANPICCVLIFFGVISFGSGILNLPFSIYHTFVIEAKFGFNKTSVKTFILDKIKAILLSAILGGGLISLITWIYIHNTNSFWILAWVVSAVFLLVAVLFYSSWILPLFNKLSPLPDGELRSAIEAYAKTVSFNLKDIYIMDGSKRSSKANAFFSGMGRQKRIVLFDTLVEKHTTAELVAVLAHEIGHYKLKHTRFGFWMSIIQTGIIFYTLSLFLGNESLSSAMHATSPTFEIELVAFGILYSPLSTILGIMMNVFSRRFEFQADAYAAKTNDGKSLSSALVKLSADSLSNLTPHRAYVFMHYSHPPLLERLHALSV